MSVFVSVAVNLFQFIEATLPRFKDNSLIRSLRREVEDIFSNDFFRTIVSSLLEGKKKKKNLKYYLHLSPVAKRCDGEYRRFFIERATSSGAVCVGEREG